MANLLAGMRSEDVEVLAVVSAAPVGPPEEHPWFSRNVVFPLLYRFFGASYVDMVRMETLLASSCAPPRWLSVRPPRLVDRPAKGTYKLQRTPVSGSHSITYGDPLRAQPARADRRRPQRAATRLE